jgi:1,4-dihydroxy-2-naphthoate octaprenyltransferase
MEVRKNKTQLWLEELRAPFFTASAIPVVLGALVAWNETGQFHWGFFFLALIGGVLMHAGTNVANDYYDHKSRADELNVDYVRPFTGGSRIIQRGLLRPREVLVGALLFFLVACLIGLYLTYERGWGVLIIGLIGLFSGYFYTAPPFFLVATGFGELIVGLNFGVLMTLGSYYVQAQKVAWEPILASLPVGFLIAAVLYINEFQDCRSDEAVGKNHLVARLGKQKAAVGYEVMLYAAYASIIVGVMVRLFSPPSGISLFAVLGLLTIPIAVKTIRIVRAHFDRLMELAPANANTVVLHSLVGILISVGYFLDEVIF